jgi:transposase
MVQWRRPTVKKNINRSIGKKLDSAGKNKKAIRPSLQLSVQMLKQKIERTSLTAEQRPEKQAAKRKPVSFYIGIDLGDKKSNYCVLDDEAEIRAEGVMATTAEDFKSCFSAMPRSRIALEVGTHSPWINALLEDLGHEVYVANPRKMESIKKSKRKNDKVDARKLARLVRSDPELVYPIQHRGIAARKDLILLRARDAAVGSRTKLINCVRGLVKSIGGRVPKCSSESFYDHARKALPESIRESLLPLVEQIAILTALIKKFDKAVAKKAAEQYPETALLRQVNGVGALTSLAFVLTLEKPERFRKSREVGPYLGLVPKQDDSGEISKQLRITKTGDVTLRRLLVSSSQYILGPFGGDCDLRRFGLKLAERGGKNAKKRATAAVARKLAVLLHRLWMTAEEYEPLRNAKLQETALAAAVNA